MPLSCRSVPTKRTLGDGKPPQDAILRGQVVRSRSTRPLLALHKQVETEHPHGIHEAMPACIPTQEMLLG